MGKTNTIEVLLRELVQYQRANNELLRDIRTSNESHSLSLRSTVNELRNLVDDLPFRAEHRSTVEMFLSDIREGVQPSEPQKMSSSMACPQSSYGIHSWTHADDDGISRCLTCGVYRGRSVRESECPTAQPYGKHTWTHPNKDGISECLRCGETCHEFDKPDSPQAMADEANEAALVAEEQYARKPILKLAQTIEGISSFAKANDSPVLNALVHRLQESMGELGAISLKEGVKESILYHLDLILSTTTQPSTRMNCYAVRSIIESLSYEEPLDDENIKDMGWPEPGEDGIIRLDHTPNNFWEGEFRSIRGTDEGILTEFTNGTKVLTPRADPIVMKESAAVHRV